MELGEFILNGPAKEIGDDQRVAASYLGFQHGESSALRSTSPPNALPLPAAGRVGVKWGYSRWIR